MRGDLAGMLATTSSVLPAWDASMPGYGFLQGCHAFGLEECGELHAAELAGHTALEHEPADAWALHAVSHVHETLGRNEEGVSWLEGARPVWSRCNNLSFHMAWHLALLHVEQQRDDQALAIYDAEVRPQPTDDFRDMANAVSLLWRLRQEGVEFGRRWDELREIARRRREDTTLMFASLHYLMALVATGETAAAHELVAAIAARAVSGHGDQARVAARVGVGLAKAILGIADRRSGRLALDQLARATPQLGGSHVQRDVFIRTLALLAADQGDRAAVARIVAQRSLIAREDRFSVQLQARLDAAAALPARHERREFANHDRRDPRLDVFRGLAMAIILMAHVPGNPVTEFIPARFGPSDAAEMFVFCSGFASAIAFGGTFRRAGFALGTLRIAHRCWQIYWSHLALFVTVAALCVAGSGLPGAVDYIHALWLQQFFAEPRQGLLHLVTFTYVPHYFDILPMYMVVLAMVPAVMALARLGPAVPLAASITLYLAQLALGWDLPAEWWSDRPWFFDPFAWQLLFFSGFAFASGWLQAPTPRRWLLWLSLAFVLLLIPVSFRPLLSEVGWLEAINHALAPLADKTHFGPLRLLHFLALAYFSLAVVQRWPWLLATPGARALATVGSRPCRSSCGACASPRCSAWRSTRPGAGR